MQLRQWSPILKDIQFCKNTIIAPTFHPRSPKTDKKQGVARHKTQAGKEKEGTKTSESKTKEKAVKWLKKTWKAPYGDLASDKHSWYIRMQKTGAMQRTDVIASDVSPYFMNN